MKRTSKKEALAKLALKDVSGETRLVTDIEKAMMDYDGLSVSVTPSVSRRVCEKVAEGYRADGWVVTYDFTQTDSYFTLK